MTGAARTVDVLVIGGSIQGCSTALPLTRAHRMQDQAAARPAA